MPTMTSEIINEYPDDPTYHGDFCEVWLKYGVPHSAQTVYSIHGFMAQLRARYPAPAGCEWKAIDTCHAQVVRVK